MTEKTMPEVGTEQAAIGERLKEARTYLGLTQELVAEELSIPRPAVSQIERGGRRVSGIELKKLATLYGRPVGWFFGDIEGTVGDTGEQTDALFRAMNDLDESDVEEVVRFAEFLRSRAETSPWQ